MNYKNWTEEQKIAHILEVLSREDLSAELTELIQGWILYEESADRKDVVMDAILERMFREHRRPVQRTFESLAGMHERLGFTDTEVRAGRRVPLRRTLTRVAAVVVALMVLGGGAVWYLSRQTASVIPVSPTMVEVVEGEGGEMVLPDGSTVRPVGDSRVTVAENFTEKRRVTLSGEAFFSVVPNAESPFTVETEKLTLTVLGTEFNLKALPGESEAEVSLVTGSVRIESGTESVVLAPMERLTYDKATGESEVSSFTPEQIDRWRFGRHRLDDLSLEQALVAVGDFYGKEVVIEGTAPENLGISTVLTDSVAVESALEAIRLVNNVFDYKITGETIYIVFGEGK